MTGIESLHVRREWQGWSSAGGFDAALPQADHSGAARAAERL